MQPSTKGDYYARAKQTLEIGFEKDVEALARKKLSDELRSAELQLRGEQAEIRKMEQMKARVEHQKLVKEREGRSNSRRVQEEKELLLEKERELLELEGKQKKRRTLGAVVSKKPLRSRRDAASQQKSVLFDRNLENHAKIQMKNKKPEFALWKDKYDPRKKPEDPKVLTADLLQPPAPSGKTDLDPPPLDAHTILDEKLDAVKSVTLRDLASECIEDRAKPLPMHFYPYDLKKPVVSPRVPLSTPHFVPARIRPGGRGHNQGDRVDHDKVEEASRGGSRLLPAKFHWNMWCCKRCRGKREDESAHLHDHNCVRTPAKMSPELESDDFHTQSERKRYKTTHKLENFMIQNAESSPPRERDDRSVSPSLAPSVEFVETVHVQASPRLASEDRDGSMLASSAAKFDSIAARRTASPQVSPRVIGGATSSSSPPASSKATTTEVLSRSDQREAGVLMAAAGDAEAQLSGSAHSSAGTGAEGGPATEQKQKWTKAAGYWSPNSSVAMLVEQPPKLQMPKLLVNTHQIGTFTPRLNYGNSAALTANPLMSVGLKKKSGALPCVGHIRGENVTTLRTIAVAAFAFSGYVVFRAVPRRMVESLMYLPRQYGKDTFTSLLKERWHGWKVEFVPLSLPRPTSSGGGAAVLPNSGRGFFFFSAVDFWSANRRRKQGDQAAKLDVWLLYGGNAMVALEFLPFCIGVVEDHLNFRETPAPTNVAFVLADFPGYGTIVPDADVARSGESDYMLNSPNRDSIYASTKQVLQKVGDLAAEQGFDPVEDVNWHALGHSIGCAAILDYMAKSREEHAQASRHTGAASEQRAETLHSKA
eukprot:g5775.t1